MRWCNRKFEHSSRWIRWGGRRAIFLQPQGTRAGAYLQLLLPHGVRGFPWVRRRPRWQPWGRWCLQPRSCHCYCQQFQHREGCRGHQPCHCIWRSPARAFRLQEEWVRCFSSTSFPSCLQLPHSNYQKSNCKNRYWNCLYIQDSPYSHSTDYFSSCRHFINIKINLPLFSTVFPSNSLLFLSCRPFVVITTLSTGLVGVEVTSVSWLGQLTVGV